MYIIIIIIIIVISSQRVNFIAFPFRGSVSI